MPPAPPRWLTAVALRQCSARVPRSAGPRPAPRHSISGNRGVGIYIDASCLVEGNLIGTNSAGTAAVPNGFYGIDVEGSGATIGGTSVGAGNVISGNAVYGVIFTAPAATGNVVEGDFIGTDASGDASPGQRQIRRDHREGGQQQHDRRDHSRGPQRDLGQWRGRRAHCR